MFSPYSWKSPGILCKFFINCFYKQTEKPAGASNSCLYFLYFFVHSVSVAATFRQNFLFSEREFEVDESWKKILYPGEFLENSWNFVIVHVDNSSHEMFFKLHFYILQPIRALYNSTIFNMNSNRGCFSECVSI